MVSNTEQHEVSGDENEDFQMPIKRSGDFEEESSSKKKKLMPTAEELRCMKETQALYRDYFFRSQLEELLIEITIKQKHKILLDSWLKKFTTFIQKLKSGKSVDISDASHYKSRGVQIPFKFCKQKREFQFVAPSKVCFTGSYSSDTITVQRKTVDVMLQLPQECMHQHDTRNGTWLMKRVHYLAEIAIALQGQSGLAQNISWSHHMGEPLRPSLLLTPVIEGRASKWRVQLLPVPPEDFFAVHAFSPQKKNIKHEGAEFYHPLNTLCCVDLVMQKNNSLLESLFPSLPGVAQGVQLLKVWLGQRSLYKGRGSFTGHAASMLALYLFRTRKLARHMSAYQVFRTILHYIATDGDWTNSGVNMYEMAQKAGSVDPFANTVLSTSQFHNLFDVVFVEPSGYLNITGTMMAHVFQQIKEEAKHCLEILSSEAPNTFELLFIKRAIFSLAFDQSIQVNISEDTRKAFYSRDDTPRASLLLNQLVPQAFASAGDVPAAAGDIVPLISRLHHTLAKGLGDRATLVSHHLEEVAPWPLGEKAPVVSAVTFGLKLHPSYAFNLLTKDIEEEGPAFQEFWGPLSNLRRYRDGTICETVAWGDGTEGIGDCRKIPGKMAKHLFALHFDIPRKDVLHIGPNVEALLRLPKSSEESLKYCTGEENSRSLVETYDRLSQAMRGLDLQPPVTGVLTRSQALAHCQTFTRKCQNEEKKPPNVEAESRAMDVVVMLAQSGKWPSELKAVESVRRQFHKEICLQLRKKNIVCHFKGTEGIAIFLDGFWFSVRVTYQGEILLLKKLAAEKFQSLGEDLSEEDSPQVLQLEINNNILPKINSALAGVQAQHPTYGPCVRLCRRWLSSHLLEPLHFPPIATQLIVAHLYLQPGQFQAPHTPYIGFLRFVFMMATTDWAITPIFVDLASEFIGADLTELQSRFTNIRESLPSLFLCTPFDIRGGSAKLQDADSAQQLEDHTKEYRYKLCSYWTAASPTSATLQMVKKIAINTVNTYSAQATNLSFDPKILFDPDEKAFDVRIHLNLKAVTQIEENPAYERLSQNDFCKKLIEKRKLQKIQYGIHHFVQYLQNYRNYVDIFYNLHGGNFIGLKWKENPGEHFDKMGMYGGFELVSKDQELMFEPHFLTSDIEKAGASILKKIDWQKPSHFKGD